MNPRHIMAKATSVRPRIELEKILPPPPSLAPHI